MTSTGQRVEATAAGAGAAAGQQAEAGTGWFGFGAFGNLARTVLIAYLVQRFLSNKSPATAPQTTGDKAPALDSDDANSQRVLGGEGPHRNLWAADSRYHLRVFLSDKNATEFWDSPVPYSSVPVRHYYRNDNGQCIGGQSSASEPSETGTEAVGAEEVGTDTVETATQCVEEFANNRMVWELRDLEYSANPKREVYFEKSFNFSVPSSLRNNGSIFTYVLLWQTDFDLSTLLFVDSKTLEVKHISRRSEEESTASEARRKRRRRDEPYEEHYDDFSESEAHKVVRISHPLSVYRKVKKVPSKRKNLLFDDGAKSKSDNSADDAPKRKKKKKKSRPIIPYWKPEVTIRPLTDWNVFARGSIPQQIVQYYNFDPLSGDYLPVVYMDDFWLLKARYTAVNDSVHYLPLKLMHNPITFWKFTMQAGMEFQATNKPAWSKLMEARPKSSGDSDEAEEGEYEDDDKDTDNEDDALRKLLLESNPYFLAVTVTVSLLHTVFDMLAFKNDIQFWKGRKSVAGISVKSMFVNAFFQVVICLYLWEQKATWMVAVSSTVGCFIEFWKISQALSFLLLLKNAPKEEDTEEKEDAIGSATHDACDDAKKEDAKNDGAKDEVKDGANESVATVPVTIQNWTDHFEWRGGGGILGSNLQIGSKKSYSESETARFDREAMRYLGYAFYPLMAGYSVYCLLYKEHKGWYQFVLHTCVSFIYMFGFITMCPQLYLNYKLKSTAHLPWRMLTYKFLNTIIDDLFAFLITMPTLHRISCFRDDLVFLVFIYQKWVYGTDMTRTNEYGYTPQTKAEEVNGDKDSVEEVAESKKSR